MNLVITMPCDIILVISACPLADKVMITKLFHFRIVLALNDIDLFSLLKQDCWNWAIASQAYCELTGSIHVSCISTIILPCDMVVVLKCGWNWQAENGEVHLLEQKRLAFCLVYHIYSHHIVHSAPAMQQYIDDLY